MKLDEKALAAGVAAAVGLFRTVGIPSDQAIAEAVVAAYLGEALKLRLPETAPEGTAALFYGTPTSPGVVGRREAYELIFDDGKSTIWQCAGWLPLPQPVTEGGA